MKHIRDPLYGYIKVREDELTIIDSKEFQRLRNVKQLGLSDIVYPGATHTRFSHSLGVMKLSGDFCKSLDLSSNEIKKHRLAGLLHDVGHLPYSHTLENLLQEKTGLKHEDISCNLIDKIDNRNDIHITTDTTELKSIINGNSSTINILSNEIDVDRMDYLRRDSYYTGIPHGEIDTETIIQFAKIIDNKLGFDLKALQSIKNLLDSRIGMSESVYSHTTVKIAESMLEKSVQLHVENSSFEMEDLIFKTDCYLNNKLMNSTVKESKYLFESIENRNIYKLLNEIYIKDKQFYEYVNSNRKIEKEIANIADIPEHKIIVNIPKKLNPNKQFKTPIINRKNNIVPLEEIYSYSNTIQKTNNSNSYIQIYVDKNNIPISEFNLKNTVKNYFITEYEDLISVNY